MARVRGKSWENHGKRWGVEAGSLTGPSCFRVARGWCGYLSLSCTVSRGLAPKRVNPKGECREGKEMGGWAQVVG
jgi:hypothetical protein